MAYCYYTCNLVPLDLVARAGYSPRWLGDHLRDQSAPARRDALSVHPLTCPYVTRLLAAAQEVLAVSDDASGESDCLLVPGGCDAMRRLGDLLAASYPERVHLLHVPRTSSSVATARLATDLEALAERLTSGRPTPDSEPGRRASGQTRDPSPSVDYPEPPRPGGVFVVSGPLSDTSLLELIHKLGAHVSALESCTSPDRWRTLAPSTATTGRSGESLETPVDYAALAQEVLMNGICPRRSTTERRDHLEKRLDASQPTSVIYARQSFCDPGAYDSLLMGQLAHERDLPYLEIEVDFPFDANGPLRTRVEAFLESQLLDDDLLDPDELFEEV